MRFVDEARILVRSGRGGKGCISFRRERFIPKGGPDGGDGGRGGHVILEASPHVHSLQDFTYQRHFKASHGGHGRGKTQHGRDAPDLVLKVPIGTVVKDRDTGEILGDLTRHGQRLPVVRGGHGGKGNARFATPTRQAPRFSTPPGEGEEKWLLLELKLLADVGLIGFPNCGKSTLISRLSAARPKIAPYPFTTLIPHLGMLKSPLGDRVILADIPGLVRGAHEGVGLGLRFLRHVERTRLLLHLLDMDPANGRDPLEDYHILKEELRRYDRALLRQQALVALNKIDLPGARQKACRVRESLEAEGMVVYAISALTGEGVEELVNILIQKLLSLRPALGEGGDGEQTSQFGSHSLA